MTRASSRDARAQGRAERVECTAECGPVTARQRIAHDTIEAVGVRTKLAWRDLRGPRRSGAAYCSYERGVHAHGVFDDRGDPREPRTAAGAPLVDGLRVQWPAGCRNDAHRCADEAVLVARRVRGAQAIEHATPAHAVAGERNPRRRAQRATLRRDHAAHAILIVQEWPERRDPRLRQRDVDRLAGRGGIPAPPRPATPHLA